MPKLIVICYQGHKRELYTDAVLYFLHAYFNLEIVKHPPHTHNSFTALREIADIAGILLHCPSHFEVQERDQLLTDLRQSTPANTPIAILSNPRCRLDPPEQVAEYRADQRQPPEFLLPFFAPAKPLEIESSYLELDTYELPHHTESAYKNGLERSKQMTAPEINQAISQSQWRGPGLGRWIKTFLIEANHLIALTNKGDESHGMLHDTMEHFLIKLVRMLEAHRINTDFGQLINGMIYRETQPIGIPILELFASENDWYNERSSLSLRRVCAWAHAQRQVIPMLSDSRRIITLADL